jgi:hypothetical protein
VKTVLTRTGLGYIYSVVEEETTLVRFEVSSVTRREWGMSARVTVRSTLATARTVPTVGNDYVTTERIDFLSAKSRVDFAARMDDLIPAPPGAAKMDWRLVVEDLVVKVMDSEHRPPVVVDLPSVAPHKETAYLVPYLIPTGKASILYGAGGSGKSIFAMGLAAAVQEGTSFLGWQVTRTNVLYLDWETDAGEIARRNELVSRGLGLTKPAAVRYMQFDMPLEHEMAAIAAAVAEHDIGLVIIDSVGMASSQGRDGADPAEGAIRFFRALKMLDTSVVAIDHVSGEDMRKGRAGTSKPYGSVFKWNSARNAFELTEASTESETAIMLRHRKSNVGPRSADMRLVVDWDDSAERVTFERSRTSLYEPPLVQRIIDVLASGPAAPRLVADMLNAEAPHMDPVNDIDVRFAARTLSKDGFIIIDHSGVLRLPPRDGEEDEPQDEGDQPALDL